MDNRKRILELRLWSYFGGNPDAISLEAIEVLERNAENLRRIAKSNGVLDAIVSKLTQGLAANNEDGCAEVLEAVARDLRTIVKESIKRSG